VLSSWSSTDSERRPGNRHAVAQGGRGLSSETRVQQVDMRSKHEQFAGEGVQRFRAWCPGPAGPATGLAAQDSVPVDPEHWSSAPSWNAKRQVAATIVAAAVRRISSGRRRVAGCRSVEPAEATLCIGVGGLLGDGRWNGTHGTLLRT